MSKITIDFNKVEELGLEKGEFLYLLALNTPINMEGLDRLATELFMINRSIDGRSIKLTPKGVDIINRVLIDSVEEKKPRIYKKRVGKLIDAMREYYPRGRKDGTNAYWRGNRPELIDRMTVFFRRHGDYPDEVVLAATKAYVDSFGDNTRLMKTLKYFISKKNVDGTFEYDLLTFIENLDDIDEGNSELKTTRLI